MMLNLNVRGYTAIWRYIIVFDFFTVFVCAATLEENLPTEFQTKLQISKQAPLKALHSKLDSIRKDIDNFLMKQGIDKLKKDKKATGKLLSKNEQGFIDEAIKNIQENKEVGYYMNLIGEWYHIGQFSDYDYESASNWFLGAALKGEIEACTNLAVMIEEKHFPYTTAPGLSNWLLNYAKEKGSERAKALLID